jgi:hypothetical protein
LNALDQAAEFVASNDTGLAAAFVETVLVALRAIATARDEFGTTPTRVLRTVVHFLLTIFLDADRKLIRFFDTLVAEKFATGVLDARVRGIAGLRVRVFPVAAVVVTVAAVIVVSAVIDATVHAAVGVVTGSDTDIATDARVRLAAFVAGALILRATRVRALPFDQNLIAGTIRFGTTTGSEGRKCADHTEGQHFLNDACLTHLDDLLEV